MSKAYLQGFYDYFVNRCYNPYKEEDVQDYEDWEDGWSAALKVEENLTA